MRGNIRTQEHCPICGGEFRDMFKDLECPAHKTSPKTYYVDWYHKERFKKYGFRSYRDCIDFLVEVTNKIKHKKFDPKEYKTATSKYFRFDSFIETWLKSKENEVEKKKISPGYYKKLVGYAKMFVEHFGSEDVRDIANTYRIQDFYESLPGMLSPKTQKNIMDGLQKILNDAFDRDLISHIPKFPKISVPEPNWTWIDETVQEKILLSIPAYHRPIFSFMMRYGVRPSEARALWWEDINFNHDLIYIRRSFSGTVHRNITKTKKQRILPLFPDIRQMLLSLPRVLRCDFVFTVQGHHYGVSILTKVWKKACQKAEVKGVRLYDGSRHSIASQLYNRGVSLDIIGELLGHSNSRMTKRYSHIHVEALRKMMEK